MKKTVYINDIVHNIYLKIDKVFNGTKGEKTWMLYHDALSLMTSKECKKIMEERGILDRWILSELVLNGGTPYANRTVGNSPEIMPLDCSLNKDIHEGVRRYCIYTCKLDRDDNKKISVNTPKQRVHAYRQLWDPNHLPEGIPSGKRIIEDINRIFNKNILRVVEARNDVAHGLGTQRGWQRNLLVS